MMNEQDHEPRHDLYQQTRQTLFRLYLKNSARRDTALLTVSCALLLVSLFAVQFVADENAIVALPLLCCVWGLGVGAIVVTLVSLQVGQAAVAVQLQRANKYFLSDDEETLRRINLPSIVSHLFGYLSSGIFLAAIICFIVFVALNIPPQPAAEPDQAAPYELQIPRTLADEPIQDEPIQDEANEDGEGHETTNQEAASQSAPGLM